MPEQNGQRLLFEGDLVELEPGKLLVKTREIKQELTIREAMPHLGLCRESVLLLIHEGALTARQKSPKRTSAWLISWESIRAYKKATSQEHWAQRREREAEKALRAS